MKHYPNNYQASKHRLFRHSKTQTVDDHQISGLCSVKILQHLESLLLEIQTVCCLVNEMSPNFIQQFGTGAQLSTFGCG